MIETTGPARVDAGPFHHGHTLTGHFNILRQFRSSILGNARNVYVYLPPGYDERGTDRYPVLYMQDGQNLFDPGLSFIRGQDWHLDETAESLIKQRAISPLIIVGVDHAGPHRTREFAPSRDPRRGDGGRADDYGTMLVEELKRYLDAHYLTKPGVSDTGLGGSSMGGLLTLYLGLTRSDVFGKLAVLSPSLWWDRRGVLSRVRELEQRLPLRIWLSSGTQEGYTTLHNLRILKNALVGHGWRLDQDLCYREILGARHSEADWGAASAEMLRFLFPPSVAA